MPVLGDLDGDKVLDAADIDLLLAATQGPIPPAHSLFEIDYNGNVNSIPNTEESNADIWVRQLRRAEYGDINLDGDVDFSDLLIAAQNYGSEIDEWSQGNVDGMPGIDFGDLLLTAQNYGFGMLNQNITNASFAVDWSRARSMIPEPTSAAGTLLIALMLKGRKR